MTRLVLVAMLVLLVDAMAAAAQPPPPTGDIARGRSLALQGCAYCHVVSAQPQARPTLRPPAPDFRVIANQPNTTAELLANALTGTHATMTMPRNMPNLDLDAEQVASVASFIMSLRVAQPVPSNLPSRPGNAATGHHLATTLCARCHVIARTGAGGWTNAPSFPAIADRPGATAQWLQATIEQPHIHMMYGGRSPTEAADLAAYILSLRQQ